LLKGGGRLDRGHAFPDGPERDVRRRTHRRTRVGLARRPEAKRDHVGGIDNVGRGGEQGAVDQTKDRDVEADRERHGGDGATHDEGHTPHGPHGGDGVG
jgi:hypothetical protein